MTGIRITGGTVKCIVVRIQNEPHQKNLNGGKRSERRFFMIKLRKAVSLIIFGISILFLLTVNLNARDEEYEKAFQEVSRSIILTITGEYYSETWKKSFIVKIDPLVEPGKLAVPFLIEKLKNSRDEKDKWLAAFTLEQIKDPRAVDSLLEELMNFSPLEKPIKPSTFSYYKTVINALGAIGDPDAVEPLIGLLQKHLEYQKTAPRKKRTNLRIMIWRIGESLGNLGNRRATEPLLKALKNGNIDVISAIGKLKDPRAVKPLIVILKNDGFISGSAARALGMIGGKEAEDVLIKALRNRNNWEVCLAAARGLGNLSVKRAFGLLLNTLNNTKDYGKNYSEPWEKKVVNSSGNISVQGAAAEALGKLGDERAIEPLLKTLSKESLIRTNATRGLGHIQHPKVIKALTELVKDDSWSVREAAIQGLGRLGVKEAIKLLIDRLNHDEEWNVRKAATEALGETGDAETIEILEKAIANNSGKEYPQKAIRKTAQSAIKKIRLRLEEEKSK